jgi:type IV pilus assembly protein PilB
MEATTQTGKKLLLGQLLVNQGAINEEQLDEALNAQKTSSAGKLLGEVLQELGYCTDEQIVEAMAEDYGLPFARVSAHLADPKVLEILSTEFLEENVVLPLFKIRDELTLAVSEPSNVYLFDEVTRLTGCQLHVVCATAKDIRDTLETHLPAANVFVLTDFMDEDPDISLVETQIEDITDVEVAEEGSPIVKLVNYIICSAVAEGASDIHIEPDDKNLRVRFRVDGKLFEKVRPPFNMAPAISSRIKIMASLDIAERRLPQDGGIHVLMNKRPVDLRVSTLPGQFGEKIVIRIIDNNAVLVNMEKLGFSYDMLKNWRKAVSAPNGIVLVTGPTGSGKSTTLYSALKELNDETVNICTVEDPIEFNMQEVNQFQVNDKIGFTFSGALRSLLRQDPDIIMLGEIRDEETGRIATQAALTGHLVLSTLHTNSAPGALTRLINIGIEPFLVSAALEAVLAQRLVRKICTDCKDSYEPSASVRRAMERMAGPVETYYKGEGCPKCRGTGYRGRIGIYELLVPDDNMREHISKETSINELQKLASEAGMIDLRQDGMEKVRTGITTLDEVLRVTSE